MTTRSRRPLWPVLVSLAATAILSFVAGGMVTALVLAVEAPAPSSAAGAAATEADPAGRLALSLVPAERIGAAEAAALAPEVFAAPAMPSRDLPSFGLYTVQVGTYLRPDLAEQARRNAEALGLAASTRLQVDENGRAWYSVQAGRYGDRLSAALAARSFEGAHPVSLADPASAAPWSRG